MAKGLWWRIVAAGVVALAGLLAGRSRGVALTMDELGALVFAAAAFYAYRAIAAHFDAEERGGTE